MKKRSFISIALIIILIFCVFCGCTDEKVSEAATTTVANASENSEHKGQEKSFLFEVVDKDGNITQKTIEAEGEYVGEALQNLGLISGEQGDYGIYIKEVNGIVADYNIDGTYWAFYVNGEMSMTGADQVEIVDGATYSFRVEKG